MSRILASAALALLLGSVTALAEVAAPSAEPRNDLSPTDELEPTPRTPAVTEPKPMQRTHMGRPVDPAPAERKAAPESTATPDRVATPVRAKPSKRRVAEPRRTAPPRRTARTTTAKPQRRIARTPPPPDTSLSTIFTEPRRGATAPPKALAPQGRPSADAGVPRQAMTYNYSPALPPADGALCPARPGTSLGALFACAR